MIDYIKIMNLIIAFIRSTAIPVDVDINRREGDYHVKEYLKPVYETIIIKTLKKISKKLLYNIRRKHICLII